MRRRDHIADQPELEEGDGPIALIMTPNRCSVVQYSVVQYSVVHCSVVQCSALHTAVL